MKFLSQKFGPAFRRMGMIAGLVTASFAFSSSLPTAADANNGATRSDLLSLYQWERRIILVFADAGEDPHLQQQRSILAADPSGLEERHLDIIEIVGDETVTLRGGMRDAEQFRDAFRITKSDFTALLIGKDGGVKLRSNEPLSLTDILYPTIDAMPMRRMEMQNTPTR